MYLADNRSRQSQFKLADKMVSTNSFVIEKIQENDVYLEEDPPNINLNVKIPVDSLSNDHLQTERPDFGKDQVFKSNPLINFDHEPGQTQNSIFSNKILSNKVDQNFKAEQLICNVCLQHNVDQKDCPHNPDKPPNLNTIQQLNPDVLNELNEKQRLTLNQAIPLRQIKAKMKETDWAFEAVPVSITSHTDHKFLPEKFNLHAYQSTQINQVKSKTLKKMHTIQYTRKLDLGNALHKQSTLSNLQDIETPKNNNNQQQLLGTDFSRFNKSKGIPDENKLKLSNIGNARSTNSLLKKNPGSGSLVVLSNRGSRRESTRHSIEGGVSNRSKGLVVKNLISKGKKNKEAKASTDLQKTFQRHLNERAKILESVQPEELKDPKTPQNNLIFPSLLSAAKGKGLPPKAPTSQSTFQIPQSTLDKIENPKLKKLLIEITAPKTPKKKENELGKQFTQILKRKLTITQVDIKNPKDSKDQPLTIIKKISINKLASGGKQILPTDGANKDPIQRTIQNSKSNKDIDGFLYQMSKLSQQYYFDTNYFLINSLISKDIRAYLVTTLEKDMERARQISQAKFQNQVPETILRKQDNQLNLKQQFEPVPSKARDAIMGGIRRAASAGRFTRISMQEMESDLVQMKHKRHVNWE